MALVGFLRAAALFLCFVRARARCFILSAGGLWVVGVLRCVVPFPAVLWLRGVVGLPLCRRCRSVFLSCSRLPPPGLLGFPPPLLWPGPFFRITKKWVFGERLAPAKKRALVFVAWCDLLLGACVRLCMCVFCPCYMCACAYVPIRLCHLRGRVLVPGRRLFLIGPPIESVAN